MARVAINPSGGNVLRYTTPGPSDQIDNAPDPVSPAISVSSEKENRGIRQSSTKHGALDMSVESLEPSAQRKRRRLDKSSDGPKRSQAVHQQRLNQASDRALYDPEQDIEERRAVRRDYRELARELTDSRADYLAATSDGLFDTIQRSNKLFESVRQTSDATLDSRLLVTAADLSVKRTTQLNLGNSSTGIDLDDFVSKCITFLRAAPETNDDDVATSRTSAGRRRDLDSEDDNEGRNYDEGDAFNWGFLGQHAAAPYNMRPPVPGFLLGPLSVQKRVRVAQRRERLQKRDPKDAVRPQELKSEDLEQTQNSNLSHLCTKVRDSLVKHTAKSMKAVQQEHRDEMTTSELKALMRKHAVADDGGTPLVQFVVNPKSFSQTVENLFYVSFLIRDGAVGVGNDTDMMPTLMPSMSQDASEMKANRVQMHQSIIHLDFDLWRDLIETFQIKQSIIPHREPDPTANVLQTGWYS